jgi:hypothetical protein
VGVVESRSSVPPWLMSSSSRTGSGISRRSGDQGSRRRRAAGPAGAKSMLGTGRAVPGPEGRSVLASVLRKPRRARTLTFLVHYPHASEWAVAIRTRARHVVVRTTPREKVGAPPSGVARHQRSRPNLVGPTGVRAGVELSAHSPLRDRCSLRPCPRRRDGRRARERTLQSVGFQMTANRSPSS